MSFSLSHSLTGRSWSVRSAPDRLVQTIAQRYHLPFFTAHILAARGIGLDDVSDFLTPRLKTLLPDPSSFKDMDKAVARVADALFQKEPIAVFGDYDVDGATSSSVLYRFLSSLTDKPPLVYIPDREKEGYGPNTPALLSLKDQGARLVLTVDCGTTAFDPLQAAHDAGLDVIVLDHHDVGSSLPLTYALVNPKRLDENGAHASLAAVGVTFLFVVALNRVLRERGFYAHLPEPDLFSLLDLVALGTVCDVVPLTGLNRAFVTQGLAVLSQRHNLGLRALCDVSGVDSRPNAYHLGFLLGPRINAGGRLGSSHLGWQLLTTNDPQLATDLASQLQTFNQQRQEIEAHVLLQAMEQIESLSALTYPCVFACGPHWHLGVLGIVAGRLKERYNLPAFVACVQGDRVIGSARGVSGLDVGALVLAAKEHGLLEAGGGHAMAAGFTCAASQWDAFQSFVGSRLLEQVGPQGLHPSLLLDGVLDVAGATFDLARSLQQLAPFGAGHPEPLFALMHARVSKSEIVGQGHVRCFLSGAHSSGSLSAMAFRSADSDLGQTLLNRVGDTFHLAGKLKLDTWQGQQKLQFLIEDGAIIS